MAHTISPHPAYHHQTGAQEDQCCSWQAALTHFTVYEQMGAGVGRTHCVTWFRHLKRGAWDVLKMLVSKQEGNMEASTQAANMQCKKSEKKCNLDVNPFRSSLGLCVSSVSRCMLWEMHFSTKKNTNKICLAHNFGKTFQSVEKSPQKATPKKTVVQTCN